MTPADSQRVDGVRRYRISRDIVIESARALRSLSAGLRESVVLWAGTCYSHDAHITRILVPFQSANRKRFDVPIGERLRIARELDDRGEMILVQLHTHPGAAFHSRADDCLALPRHTGAISIVVADFAVSWNGNLREASINRHLGGGVWKEVGTETGFSLFEVR